MKQLVLLLIFSLLLASNSLYAQSRVVQGVVADNKEALPGVSVYEKDTPANGVSTDADGRYRLALKGKSGILVFRAVGYTLREVQAGTRTTVDVKLESNDQALSDVVVTAYGEQKKQTLTGAVSVVSGRDIRENPSASLQNSLAGRLPGFFSQQGSGAPGADGAAFFIRGVSSYNGNNQPLIVVDDVQYSYDQFARLDPNEIESLSILKDASTTAIYGIQGANGVVVVTTRRGKEGPPQVSVRQEFSLSQPTILTHYLDAYQSASLYTQAQINDNAINPSPTFKPTFSPDDLQKFQDGSDPYGHPNVDWRKTLFKDFSQQTRTNLDMSGGTQRVKYFVSLGYLFQNGLLKDFSAGQDINSNYYQKRYNYRSNLDMNVAKGLNLRLDLYGNFAEVNTPNVGSPFGNNDIFYDYNSFFTLAPFAYPVYNPNGTYGYSTFVRNNGSYNVNNVVGRLANFGYSRNSENNMNVVLSAKQDFSFLTKGLSLLGRVAYTSNYYYTRALTRNQFASYIYDPTKTDDPSTPFDERYEVRDPANERTQPFAVTYTPRSTIRVLNVQAILGYDRTFGDHHFSGLALVNTNSRTSVADPSLDAATQAIYNFIPNTFRGTSVRVGYDYKQKYLLEFNGGYNGSSRFTAAKRYGFFPALSAGWNISEEPIFKNNVPAVNLLKIRGSYGLVGNDALGNGFTYYYLQNYSPGQTGVAVADFGTSSNQYPGIQEGGLANPNVTWEKERKLDVGVEIGLFKNAVTGSVDYFNNNRYDILTTRGTVSSIFGQTLPPVNLGEVNNRGYELQLTYRQAVGKNFSFSVGGNYSVAKNKIVFQDEPHNQYDYQNYTGHSIGQQRVYTWIGFYKDADDIAKSPQTAVPVAPGDLKYADLNGDGKITQADQAVQGSPNLPTTTYGINASVRYKAVSISVLFQGAKDFSVRGSDVAIRAFQSNLTELHTHAWTPALGDDALYPRLSLNGGISDPGSFPSTYWLIPGDYIRLKTAQINFDLPGSFTKKLGIPQARLYANGNNLFTSTKLSKLYDIDPEITLNGGNPNKTVYPPQRLLNLGLSVTF